MTVSKISYSNNQYIPSAFENAKKAPAYFTRIVQNINKIAIPAIALYAFSNAPTAEAGRILYALCLGACAGLTPPATVPCSDACYALAYFPWW